MTMQKVYARAKGIDVETVRKLNIEVPPPEECDCYECAETQYSDDGSITNNFKWHTLYQPCDDCDGYRTDYLDLGRKGYFVCPNVPHRNP